MCPENGNENAVGKSKSRGGQRPGFSVVKPLSYQELSQGYSIPFLHIGDCMVGELKEANLKPIETGSNVKIGLLGTEETLRVGFYQDRLSNQEEITGEWQRCTTRFKYIEEVQSVVEYHRNLTRKGYRALIFRGDHEMVFPFIGTEARIRTLNYTIVDDWRSWWVDRQIVGYTRLYDNSLTFATVKGAGHTTP